MWTLVRRVSHSLTHAMSIMIALLLSSRAVAEETATHAVATHEFTASQSDELSLRRGERVRMLSWAADGEDGWGRAEADGRVGLVPTNYLRAEEPPSQGLVAQRARVAADGAAARQAEAYSDDPEVAEALRQYRSRKARYNGDPEMLRRWGVELADDLAMHGDADSLGSGDVGEHRSGVGGVPFYNLIEYFPEPNELAFEIMRSLRREWLAETRWFAADADPSGSVPGLDAALDAVATPGGRDVILTFANLGYADFVLNGFAPVKAHTLVVALDAEAHALFGGAGMHSFYADGMPSITPAAAGHRSSSFMDIMKLRLLLLAEALSLGYNALLTDADAVFNALPFAVFPRDADLVVACDATVVPLQWREAPGMVMAGFFYAKAGVRPIIFIKEVRS